eukprot:7583888-Pyramimonas_sp.AAC.1
MAWRPRCEGAAPGQASRITTTARLYCLIVHAIVACCIVLSYYHCIVSNGERSPFCTSAAPPQDPGSWYAAVACV